LNLPGHILVIRLSAPGDVAMTVPVLYSFQKAFPSVRLTILTNKKLKPLFEGIHATFFFAETKGEHKGMTGLFRLFRQLNHANKEDHIDAVADLHNVLRSQVIRRLFFLKGIKTAAIDKDRPGKQALTKKENKNLHQLTTTFDRYKQVFLELGFDFKLDFTSIFRSSPVLTDSILSLTGPKKEKWIGIAPFASYVTKMYPLQKTEQVIRGLMANKLNKLVVFGSAEDATTVTTWPEMFPGIIIAAGAMSLGDELKLMAHLDVMISMDSANMHFASLVNVPVVSVWGPTHRYLGFMGWGQQAAHAVELDLYCRPCSVFGNKPCYRGDHACMNELSPVLITEKAEEVIINKK
jgi:ADP-heptose:LPS heptosyltransferase